MNLLRRLFGMQDDPRRGPPVTPPAPGRDVVTCTNCKQQFKAAANLPIQVCPRCNHPIRLQTPTYQR